jgi:hypothetical protein
MTTSTAMPGRGSGSTATTCGRRARRDPAMMQNGILDRVFQDALLPEFLFPAIADASRGGRPG